MSRRRRVVTLVGLVSVGLLVGVPLWIVGRAFLRDKATHELAIAVYKNDTQDAIEALRAGADANARRYADDEPPTVAQFVRQLWVRPPTIKSDADHRPPLIALAAKQNNTALLKAFLKYGANPNAHSRYAHEFDIDARDLTWGHTPLYWAGTRDNATANRALLDKGADPNLCGRQEDDPPLLLTIDAAIVKPLLDHGAWIDSPSRELRQEFDWRFTALHRCAEGPNGLPCLRLLLERGANVNARSGDDSTPLLRAAKEGNVAQLDLLLAHGADINATNDLGETALLLAVTSEDRNNAEKIVSRLIQAGANVNIKDGRFASPLGFAEANGKTGIIKLLRAAGAKR